MALSANVVYIKKGFGMQQNKWLQRLFLFVVFVFFYGVLWVIGSNQWNVWVSPMHWLVPVVGFWLAFLCLDWIESYFEVRAERWWLPVLFAVLAVLVFYVSAWFYYCNGFSNIQDPAYRDTLFLGCSNDGSKTALDFISSNFWGLFSKDAFFFFALSALFGWAAFVIWRKAILPQASVVAAKRANPKKKK